MKLENIIKYGNIIAVVFIGVIALISTITKNNELAYTCVGILGGGLTFGRVDKKKE